MKIIFSRKGFDSTAGGFPSLIFPDGSLFSIPIPSDSDPHSYADLDFKFQGEPIQEILRQVTGGRIRAGRSKPCDYGESQHCHYDPMPIAVPGFNGIALGQMGATEGHLRKQGVGEGDIFLFYGWFRRVVKDQGRWSYDPKAPDIHLIWAYMETGEVLPLDTPVLAAGVSERYPFLERHPHLCNGVSGNNRIYLSRKAASFSYDEKRCLTDLRCYRGRATWRLPGCFNQLDAFSFLNNFSPDGDEVVISYKGYGQEFVLDLDRVASQVQRDDILGAVQAWIV